MTRRSVSYLFFLTFSNYSILFFRVRTEEKQGNVLQLRYGEGRETHEDIFLLPMNLLLFAVSL